MDFAHAAKCAMRAGFDGVGIHGANGYLVDQFTQDTSNHRTDIWGGSVENRNRFGVEVARAVADAIGPEKTGYRISPWSRFQDMRMADPVSQFSDLVRSLKALKLGYLHIIEARVTNSEDVAAPETVDFVLDIWQDQTVVLLAGGASRRTTPGIIWTRCIRTAMWRWSLAGISSRPRIWRTGCVGGLHLTLTTGRRFIPPCRKRGTWITRMARSFWRSSR